MSLSVSDESEDGTLVVSPSFMNSRRRASRRLRGSELAVDAEGEGEEEPEREGETGAEGRLGEDSVAANLDMNHS